MQTPSPTHTGLDEPGLLDTLADRVRALRHGLKWSQAELAERSGLSLRFLARIEAGEGNVSILRLASLARALGTTPDRLVRPRARRSEVISLVGLRGAGKSTIGPLLARRLGRPFIEMDARIAEVSGLTLDQLFELHGERYYRRLEHEVLRTILSGGEPAVVAAAGGVVNELETWRLLCEHTTVVWLRARPEEHWMRVVAQGDRRPMANQPAAMDELRSILAAREPVYAQAALTVETSGIGPTQVVTAVETALARHEAGPA